VTASASASSDDESDGHETGDNRNPRDQLALEVLVDLAVVSETR
jgi:hypothetical protein